MISVGSTEQATRIGANAVASASAAADAVVNAMPPKPAAPAPPAPAAHQVLDVVEFYSQFQGARARMLVAGRRAEWLSCAFFKLAIETEMVYCAVCFAQPRHGIQGWFHCLVASYQTDTTCDKETDDR